MRRASESKETILKRTVPVKTPTGSGPRIPSISSIRTASGSDSISKSGKSNLLRKKHFSGVKSPIRCFLRNETMFWASYCSLYHYPLFVFESMPETNSTFLNRYNQRRQEEGISRQGH
jgi:hypothetical protein